MLFFYNFWMVFDKAGFGSQKKTDPDPQHCILPFHLVSDQPKSESNSLDNNNLGSNKS